MNGVRLLKIFNVCWFFIWTGLFIHYGEKMNKYSKMGLHTTNTVLYVAVECWALFSLVMMMLILFKMLRDASK